MDMPLTVSDVSEHIINGATRVYAIIGHPITQVRSPEVFTTRLRAAGRNAILVPADVLPEKFEETVRGLMALGNLDGLVVTVPYKLRALGLADTVLPTGQRVGAVNAMRREADGTWTADMFDGKGLVRALTERNHALAGTRVLLLGAGGAGSAVAVALADAGAAAITLHDVDQAKAGELAARVAGYYPNCTVAVGKPDPAGHDILVNASPIGMGPSDGLPVPLGKLPSSLLVVDVIMKPEVTPLLRHAAECGCPHMGGRPMLDGQGDEVMKFFTREG